MICHAAISPPSVMSLPVRQKHVCACACRRTRQIRTTAAISSHRPLNPARRCRRHGTPVKGESRDSFRSREFLGLRRGTLFPCFFLICGRLCIQDEGSDRRWSSSAGVGPECNPPLVAEMTLRGSGCRFCCCLLLSYVVLLFVATEVVHRTMHVRICRRRSHAKGTYAS